MNKPLIIGDKDYGGMYVTTAQGSQEVISSSDSPAEAWSEAKKECNDPVLIYVPNEDEPTYLI